MIILEWQGVIVETVQLNVQALATVLQIQNILISLCVIAFLQFSRNIQIKRRKKIPVNKSKHRLKVAPQARFNICIHNAPITSLAQSFDKSLPNRILIPANKLTKKVTLRLKNKTFRQIIISSGLSVKG